MTGDVARTKHTRAVTVRARLFVLLLLLATPLPPSALPWSTPAGSTLAGSTLPGSMLAASAAQAAPADWTAVPVTAARLGSSHRPGCPVRVADLRLVRVVHWRFDGRQARGELVVHRDVAAAVLRVFRALHAARFPLAQVTTVERFGADDDRAMAANATTAYNCRRVTGGTGWSEHAYGRAIDVDPVQNPYVRGRTVAPRAGRAYLDRTDVRPGMVVPGGPVVRAFTAQGWSWGGDYRSLRDYQHFSRSGR